MSGFTDYHAHFVYGVDDGARTREEMFVMPDAAAADGVTRLFATSHSTPGMEPFPRDVYQRHLDFARAYCAEKGYDLMLESGSELLYTPAAAYAAAEHSLVTLGGTDWVLLEFVPDVAAAEVETALRQITGSGYRVLLAHIERYPRLARSGALPRLKEQYGIRCQVNAATVLVYLLLFALLGPAVLDELLADGTAMLVALLAAGNLSFWLCDRALAALTRYYHLVVKPKLKKKF